MSSSPPERPKHGFVAWTVFIAAVLTVLAISAGCTVMVYGAVFTG